MLVVIVGHLASVSHLFQEIAFNLVPLSGLPSPVGLAGSSLQHCEPGD